MNFRQLCTLIVGLAILVLMALFPPVNRVQTVKVVNESTASEETQVVQSEFQGYESFFSMPNPQGGSEYRIATTILAGQCLAILILMWLLYVKFRGKKPRLPEHKIFQRP
jgi:hypothetical protein